MMAVSPVVSFCLCCNRFIKIRARGMCITCLQAEYNQKKKKGCYKVDTRRVTKHAPKVDMEKLKSYLMPKIHNKRYKVLKTLDGKEWK